MSLNVAALQKAMTASASGGFSAPAAAAALDGPELVAFQSFGSEPAVTSYYSGDPGLGIVAAQQAYSSWLLAGYAAPDARSKALAFFQGVAASAASTATVAVTLPDGWGFLQGKPDMAGQPTRAILVVPAGTTKAQADAWLQANAPNGIAGGFVIEGTAYAGSPEATAYGVFPYPLPPPLGTAADSTATVLKPAVTNDAATAPRPQLPTAPMPTPVQGVTEGTLLTPANAVQTGAAVTTSPAAPAPVKPLDPAKAKMLLVGVAVVVGALALLALLAKVKVK